MGEYNIKITNNTKNTKTTKTTKNGNVVHIDEIANGLSSARPHEAVRIDPFELISDESLHDCAQEKSGIGECEFRNWDEEISQINYNNQMDVTYAKLSIFKTKKNIINLNFTYRNPQLYNNSLQTVLFSLTDKKKDFLGNLNAIWGPHTNTREPYATVATAMKTGIIACAGKGRPSKKSIPGQMQRRAPLYPDSVAFFKVTKDAEYMFTVQHHGFAWKWFFNDDNIDFKQQGGYNRPLATGEYRRSEHYGY